MKLNIIVAVDTMGGFGKEGKIPWSMTEDMEHFKKTTNEHVCVMGRRTYIDMLTMRLGDKKPTKNFSLLPNRNSYVITSDDNYATLGSTRMDSLSAVLKKYRNTDREVFVLGGYRMFVEALSYKPIIHMTIIKGDNYECDVRFPIKILNNYRIMSGNETEQCYYVKYIPI